MVDQILAYLSRPYHFEIVPAFDEDGAPDGWEGRVVEMRWCVAYGATPEELVAALRANMHTWIETALERGRPIPEPLPSSGWSNEVRATVPSDVRARLADLARDEDMSLEAFVAGLLAETVERREAARPGPR